MPESDYWERFSQAEWQDLARKWFAEIRGNRATGESAAGKPVVSMNFTARPEIQWQFILIAVSLAESDDELSHVAAGPIEHLLGWHGEDYISLVEKEAATNPKFRKFGVPPLGGFSPPSLNHPPKGGTPNLKAGLPTRAQAQQAIEYRSKSNPMTLGQRAKSFSTKAHEPTRKETAHFVLVRVPSWLNVFSSVS